MTLYKQLVIFTMVLFLLLFTGTWLAKLGSTRTFLIDQLESHAQDTATSLGLSISQFSAEHDMSAIESMINAVFDRGYYRSVRYSDNKNNVLIERTSDVAIENVPQWFIRLFTLKTPEAAANVMAGWNQAGTVFVKSHPGYAYRTLWENVVRISLWFLTCAAVVLIAGGYGLRVLLKPLFMVERQAEALCNRKYEIQEKLPKTKELRRMVEAMNRMTGKVKDMFEEQVTLAEGLRRNAYHDSLTGLGNRRYFESQITARLDRRESTTKGILLLVEISNLHELNKRKGFEAGDELLQRVAVILREATKQYANAVLARLTGGDFGIFVPDVSPWDAESIAETVSTNLDQLSAESVAENVSNNLNRLAVEQLTLTDNVGHVGAVSYDSSTTIRRLLSEADLALRSAQQVGPNKWHVRAVTDETEQMPLGQQKWKETLELALSERKVVLYAQPVVDTYDRNKIIHYEIFSRIVQEDGSIISAGVFMPFAERLNLVAFLDRIVLEDAMQIDAAAVSIDRLAVNLSPTSLQNDSFRRWILFAAENLPDRAPRINFEFSEFAAVQHIDIIKEFSAVVRKNGNLVGLDHYGQSFSHLGYLKSLQPDYVKIDRAYTGELKHKDSDSRFFIGSLCSVAHSLDIAVIAEGVETDEQWEQLKDLNLDAIQGYIVDKPKPLREK
ncbi:MAG: EAL domain-containing protein [Desulfobulbales bacterium]|nr:EAL domain-containing protein [Desulfobulbales bacterium]